MQDTQTQLQQANPNITVSILQLPDGYTLNNIWEKYGREAIEELINERHAPKAKNKNRLEFINEFKIGYSGKAANYLVIGRLPHDMASLRVALQVIDKTTERIHRIKIDLYDFQSVQNQCRELSDKNNFDHNLLEADLMQLTDLLERHREELFYTELNPIGKIYSEKELTPKAGEKAIEFLSSANLTQNIGRLLGEAGIIGEEYNRTLLFVIALSHKMPTPLHGMLQGSSGEGKSHLIIAVSQCMPQENVLDFTRITPKSLYHYKGEELSQKLLIVQDFDGLDVDAQYAFREMQSSKRLSSSSTSKDALGNLRGKITEVRANSATLVATTKAEVYLDNMSRSVILGVDESESQTQRIIQRQNQKRAGTGNAEAEHEAKQLLRNCVRVLKPYQVVNPFADRLTLPFDARTLRRLNEQFQDFICQITLLHQFQRKTDSQGRLIATKEDVNIAVEIFFSAIILKVDELDAGSRQFFDKLKAYVKKQSAGTTYKFTQLEVRQAMNLPRTSAFNQITRLQQLEYIQAVEGSANRGFKYVVSHWDNMEKRKGEIKADLNKQLEKL